MNPDELNLPKEPTIDQLNNDLQYIYDYLMQDVQSFCKEYHYESVMHGLMIALLTLGILGKTPLEDIIYRMHLFQRKMEEQKNLGK